MATHIHYDPLSKEFELVMVDALTHFVQAKMTDPDQRIDRFFQDYFRKVKIGEHVFLRSYEFISGSEHSKKMFISLFWKTYHQLAFAGELLGEADYYNLLLFLCPDFPKSVVEKAFMTVASPVEGKLYFSDFIYSFQLCFYFGNFMDNFRETLIFDDRILAKDRIVETANDTHSLLSKLQNSGNTVPPMAAVKAAFSGVDLYESWKVVQSSLVRSDAMNNAVGILPLRSTMVDHESLKTIIPSEWHSRKHVVQPTLLTLTAHQTNAFENYSQPEGRLNGISSNTKSTLSNSKLLKRPSKQFKLGALNTSSSQTDVEASEQSSVAENTSTAGSVSTSSSKFRGTRRGKLPAIPGNGPSSTNTGPPGKLPATSSLPSNLNGQVIDEQSSSEDRTSSLSSDADN